MVYILLNITQNEWLVTAISYSSSLVIYAYGVFEALSHKAFYSYHIDMEISDQRQEWLAWDDADRKQESWDLNLVLL